MMMYTALLCRVASDRRIDVDKQKRDAIEQHKENELEAHRAEVTSWQNTVGQGTCSLAGLLKQQSHRVQF